MCPSLPGLDELPKNSLILWIKTDCSISNHDQLTNILRENFVTQTIMVTYLALKSNGTDQPSIK